MKVEAILNIKGRDVEIVRPDTSMVVVIHKLTNLRIGAVVVSGDGERVDGVFPSATSFRDRTRMLSSGPHTGT